MEAMHSWKIFLIMREKLEFNPPVGPGPSSSPQPHPHSPIPSRYTGKFSRPSKQQLSFVPGFTEGFYSQTDPPTPFLAGQTDRQLGRGTAEELTPLGTYEVPAIKWDFQRCVLKAVTLKTEKIIIKRDSPQHFPSYPK